MRKLQIDDFTNSIDQKSRDIICDVILSWARFDSLVSHWLIQAFEMDLDRGAILLGNMDTRTKLERLKKLYAHFGENETVQTVASIQTKQKAHAPIRNAIAHMTCAGNLKGDGSEVAFSSIRRVHKQPGKTLVEVFSLHEMQAAAQFASDAADQLIDVLDKLLGQLEEQPTQSEASTGTSPPSPQR